MSFSDDSTVVYSDTETDMEYETDSDDEIYDQIGFDEELLYVNDEEPECIHGKYYLSSVFCISPKIETPEQLLIDKRIDRKLFFKYDYHYIREYTHLYPEEFYFTNQVEIVQVLIEDGCCTAVIKTGWIKKIQRAWRRTLQKREQWLNDFKKNVVKKIDFFQRTGKLEEPYP